MGRHSDRESEISSALNSVLSSYNTGQHRYLDEFIKQWQSASDLLILGIYPNAKEITESYAAFNCVRTKLKYDLSDPNCAVVCVGDGRSPRTAALFAFRTGWHCISIDPMLDERKIPVWESKVQRLTCIPKKVEDVDLMFDKVTICCVHSHANLPNVLEHIRGKVRSLVAIPCCIPYNHDATSHREYHDAGVWSPHNLVKYWRTI